MPAKWIAPRDKELAEALGYTVVDHATVIATHLGELLRTNSHRLLGRQEVQHLLDLLARKAPKLVDDVVPNLLSLGDVVRVMRNLVREGVSVRDTRTILESLAELSAQTKDVEQLTELLRERLAPHITSRLRSADGTVTALTLDPRLEEVLRKSLRDIATGAGGALELGFELLDADGFLRALGEVSELFVNGHSEPSIPVWRSRRNATTLGFGSALRRNLSSAVTSLLPVCSASAKK
jgi:flagellar biosynthesis protein FlhA